MYVYAIHSLILLQFSIVCIKIRLYNVLHLISHSLPPFDSNEFVVRYMYYAEKKKKNKKSLYRWRVLKTLLFIVVQYIHVTLVIPE